MTQKPHKFRSKAITTLKTVSLLISAALCTSAYATPKTVIISLDGATPRIVDQLNANGQLNPNEGLNLLRAKGFSAQQNITIAPVPGQSLSPKAEDTARELAQIAIDQAVVANVNPQQIAAAQQMIQQGDASVASGDFVSAIQSFQHAWQRVS
jgi:hypothetical protein